ncbi:lamin tail domain-containing protein [Actinoplanes sp. NPDC026623]|uniref:lamin tail domain-containing protein n=1 Tax=Actinoplanes sp. NPDC026623 TaxID=3155610 RepID=UPI0033E00A1E
MSRPARKVWRWLAVGTAVTATAAAGMGVASAATAPAPTVQLTKVYYNSPGSDTRTTTSLNAEYIRLTNQSRATINLKGWTVRDATGHTYTFGSYNLGAGKRVYVHTGKGTNGRPDAQHLYWRSGNYIWNNTGDTATLRNSAGKTAHTCKWGSKGAYTYCGVTEKPAPTTPTPPRPTQPTTKPPTTAPTTAPTTPPVTTWPPDPTPPAIG